MFRVARDAGLKPAASGAEIWRRLSNDGANLPQPIPGLFALYDMRILKAHKSEDQTKLTACLGRFGIETSEAAGGFGMILDHIYDALIVELAGISQIIEAALTLREE